jgi:predicted alpha/beta hydrolase
MPSNHFTLHAADGYALAATQYQPAQASLDAVTGRSQYIVIGNATAVPRGFYKRFCEYAASLGLHAVVVDYRGVGDSKLGSLRGFEMNYADWSTLDLAAAVAYASERGECYLVGHSLGGHAIGQLPDPGLLRAAYVCGGGAGWAGWMPWAERIKVGLLWNVIGPVITRWYGYQPMSKLGLGEDIPMGVYRDWKRWCSFPRYFFDDPAPDAKAIAAKFERVRLPIAAAASTDDLWAPPKSRDAFFSGYVHAPVDRIDLNPLQLGVSKIGHMGYFRREMSATLWPQIMAWLGQHGLRVQSST